LVNDSLRDKEYGLQEGDKVKIFSFIGGGWDYVTFYTSGIR
jgi:sulfur carrier protein ThiS